VCRMEGRNKQLVKTYISCIETVYSYFRFQEKRIKDSKGNKTVPGKVATTHTEDGHKQDT